MTEFRECFLLFSSEPSVLLSAIKYDKNQLYIKIIVLPVYLNGYETWPLILQEKHRQRVSDNKCPEYLEVTRMKS
jgi:hypothetical protein